MNEFYRNAESVVFSTAWRVHAILYNKYSILFVTSKWYHRHPAAEQTRQKPVPVFGADFWQVCHGRYSYLRVCTAGFVPGMCSSTSLQVNDSYIILADSVIYKARQTRTADWNKVSEVAQICGLQKLYPTGTSLHYRNFLTSKVKVNVKVRGFRGGSVLLLLDHVSGTTYLPVYETRKSAALNSKDNWKHSCFRRTAAHRDFFDYIAPYKYSYLLTIYSAFIVVYSRRSGMLMRLPCGHRPMASVPWDENNSVILVPVCARMLRYNVHIKISRKSKWQ